MKILISNDDGIDSPGIQFLAKEAATLGEVTVVAPHRERSTAGHSLTLHKPLRIHERGPGQFMTSGTPADCIYLGTRQVLKGKPDLILSGINRGANLGTDVFYSGTVAAAREGALLNVKSYAFSLVSGVRSILSEKSEPYRFEDAAKAAIRVVKMTMDLDFPPHTLLNVNIPNGAYREDAPIVLAHQGLRFYSNDVNERIDPRGKPYYWIWGDYAGFEENADTDCHALDHGKIAVTPLTIDCTHKKFYATLKERLPTER